MKIAIQGHPTRGKEVIQILESLGGINKWNHTGECVNYAYYIDYCNNIYSFGISGYHGDRKIYTLEEFEKSFPFKIGDKVRARSDDEIGTILGFIDLSAFINVCNELMYVVDFEKSGHANMPVKKLKPYKEMKEERNITLTLDKAKEWYKKGGELKEIALQAFTEDELTKIDLPKTWEEFYEQYKFKNSLNACLNAISVNFAIKYVNKFEAFIKLQYLRDCWRQDWEPDWNDEQQTKYCVSFYRGKLKISILCETRYFLSFPTMKMAEEFLKCFRDLIEKAGDLI